MNNIGGSSNSIPVNPGSIQKAPEEQSSTKILINLPDSLSVQDYSSADSLGSLEIEELELHADRDMNTDLESVIEDANQLDNLIEVLPQLSEESFPSLSDQINRWGNEELSLLFHEYQVAKKITGGAWQATEAVDIGIKVGAKGVAPYVMLGGSYIPGFQEMSQKIQTDIYGVALAYKIPAQLGKVSVLVYKHIFLSKIEDMLKQNPPNMTEAQKIEFQEWVNSEKKEISKAAVGIAKEFGFSLPGNLVTLIRICQLNVPILRLGLSWIDGILGPIGASLELRAATKEAIKVQRDINQFHDEMYRRTNVEAADTNAIIHAMQDRNNLPEEIVQAAIEHRLTQNVQTQSAEEVRQQVLADIGGGDLHADEIIQAALYQRTGKDAAVIRNKRRDTLLEMCDKPQPDSDVSFEVGFARVLEEAYRKDDFAAAKNFLEEEGLSIDPEITSIAELQGRLEVHEFRENMLARYIDVKGTQQLTDSARNALKNLTVKKQSILKLGALARLAKSKILLAATVVCSVAAIALTTIAATGLVAIPLIAFFIPGFGMLGLGGVLLAVGTIKFYKNSPNLFSEYVKMSVVKIAAYNIPKGINEVKKSLVAIKMLKNSMATREISMREQLADTDITKARDAKKTAKLELEAAELKAKMDKIDSKIAHWNEKIKPLAEGVAKAKWMDFLQDRPKRVKKEGREHEAGIRPLGSMPKKQAEEEVTAIVRDIKNALTVGTSVIDKELCQLARERWNVDIELMRGPELEAAILRFVP